MEIKTFVNNPVPSNCFLIIKDEHVIVVDPGSKDCSELITYIKSKKSYHLIHVVGKRS